MVSAGLDQFWRAGRADRLDAPGVGGAAPVALGAALSPRPQLLHGVAGPRGHSAGHLPGLVDAWGAGRPGGRRPVFAAFGDRADRPVEHLCAVGPIAAPGRRVLGAQARGAGDRGAGGLAAGAPHPAHPAPGVARCFRLFGLQCFAVALSPGDRPGGPGRMGRRPLAARLVGLARAPSPISCSAKHDQ